MPIYEYQCEDCGAEFSTLIMKKEEEQDLSCERCGGKGLKRLISRVSYHTSEADRLNSYNPGAAQSDSFYRDTRNIGLSAQKRAQAMGVDLGASFEAKLDKLRSNPKKVFDDAD